MKKYINYLICILIFEKKVFRRHLESVFYFLKNINFIRFIFFLIDKKKYNPIKLNSFRKFIDINKKKKWKYNYKSQNEILIENFINHPAYTLTNSISACLLNKYYDYNLSAVLRSGDIKAEVLFRSFGIKKFYKIQKISFLKRFSYIIKAISLIKEAKTIKSFLNLKYKKIEVALSSYDTYIRYTGNPNLKFVNNELIVILAECLYHCDFFENLIEKNNQIKFAIQSETVFNPLNSFFQICLKNKIQVFSRCGENNVSLRRYTNFSQRHNYRYNISQKLFDNFFKNNKKKINSEFNKFYKKKITSKKFGIDSRISGLLNKEKIDVKKEEIIDKFKIKRKKIGVFFLNHLIDRNFHNGPRKNFQDNYSWTEFILKEIPKIKNINWIIKPHPTEYFYNAKKNFDKELIQLERDNDNIILYPFDYSSSSLLKITDYAITSHGTVGVEYPAFGIKSIFSENSFYSRFNFMKIIKNKKDLSNQLKNLHRSKKISSELSLKCKALLLIRERLLENQCKVIPNHIISRKIDENLFWEDGAKKLKKWHVKDDLFYKMLRKQIKLKMRHTINFNYLKIDQKIFNDFS